MGVLDLGPLFKQRVRLLEEQSDSTALTNRRRR
jgi:hypothetical protein